MMAVGVAVAVITGVVMFVFRFELVSKIGKRVVRYFG